MPKLLGVMLIMAAWPASARTVCSTDAYNDWCVQSQPYGILPGPVNPNDPSGPWVGGTTIYPQPSRPSQPPDYYAQPSNEDEDHE